MNSPVACLPPSGIALYESLRADLLLGRARREGLTAFRFHGMWHGLMILLKAPAIAAPAPDRLIIASSRGGTQFIRLLANLILHVQSEVTHVC